MPRISRIAWKETVVRKNLGAQLPNLAQELLENVPQRQIGLDLPFYLILPKQSAFTAGRPCETLPAPEVSNWQSRWLVPKWHEPFAERPESVQGCTGG